MSMTDPLDICLLSGGMPHDGTTLKQRSLGGSETAAVNIAIALARRGHDVTVFSPGHQGMRVDGVTWLPIEAAPQYLTTTQHDVLIVSRDLGAAAMPTVSACKVLWCHDLALKRNRTHFASALWDIDAVFVLSEFQRAQYELIQPLAKPLLTVTRNGLDLSRFGPRVPLAKRDPFKLVYGSRPERGLEVLIHVMALAAQRGLPWKLYVSSYDNPIPQLGAMYEALYAQARAVGTIALLGAKTQREWTASLATARAMVYPGVQSDFREISCLAAMEAQACGTPIVAAAKGAVPETVHPDAGVLLGDESTNVNDPGYHARVLDAIESLRDDARWETMSQAGHAHARTLGWDPVAEQWEDVCRRVLAQRTDNAWRVTRHLERTGDHEAAEATA